MAVSTERVGAAFVVTIDRPERRNAVDGPTAEAMSGTRVQEAVQVTVAGAVLAPVKVPVKPQLVVALAARRPFQAAFLAVTVSPEVVTVALHVLLNRCPFGQVQLTVHAVIAALPAVTVTSPWNPPGHEFVTR